MYVGCWPPLLLTAAFRPCRQKICGMDVTKQSKRVRPPHTRYQPMICIGFEGLQTIQLTTCHQDCKLKADPSALGAPGRGCTTVAPAAGLGLLTVLEGTVVLRCSGRRMCWNCCLQGALHWAVPAPAPRLAPRCVRPNGQAAPLLSYAVRRFDESSVRNATRHRSCSNLSSELGVFTCQ